MAPAPCGVRGQPARSAGCWRVIHRWRCAFPHSADPLRTWFQPLLVRRQTTEVAAHASGLHPINQQLPLKTTSTHLVAALPTAAAKAISLAEAPLLFHVVCKDASIAVAAGLGVPAQLVRLLRGRPRAVGELLWRRSMIVRAAGAGGSCMPVARYRLLALVVARWEACYSLPNIHTSWGSMLVSQLARGRARHRQAAAAAGLAGRRWATIAAALLASSPRRQPPPGPHTTSPSRLPVPALAGSEPCPSW